MSKTAPEKSFTYSPEMAEKVRNSRNPLSELREAQVFQQEEDRRAENIVKEEVSNKCRPEIDDYVDCTTGRSFSIIVCKDLAMRMRRCLIKHKTAINLTDRKAELVEELIAKGETLDRGMLSRRNNMFTPTSSIPPKDLSNPS